MQIGIDFLSQIPRLLRELAEIVQQPLDRRRERRHEFYEKEISPAHESMVAIHEDYLSGFKELLALMDSHDDLDRTIELLRTKRLVMLTKRKDRQAFAEALKDVRKRGYLKQKELARLVDYSEAIQEYIRAASPADSRVSWYSAFIDSFEALAKRGESPYGATYPAISSGGPPAAIVRDAVAEAIQRDLPEAWQAYSTAYQALQLELTR